MNEVVEIPRWRRPEAMVPRSELMRERRRYATLVAASQSRSSPSWMGINSTNDEDAANKQYQYDRGAIVSRSQDQDVNNPDVHGFHRARVAQIMGRQVHFKATPKPDEVNLDPKTAAKTAEKLNRARQLHSREGGFDASGFGRSEGKLQEKALLTMFVHGDCLVHRVWRPTSQCLLPLSLEIIPGSRMSTPYNRAGDPLLSYGIEYSDTNRSRVVAFHVRRVSQSRGNNFVPDYRWDRLPVEDCSLLSLNEVAGIDRALPLQVANMRMLRNRGEFIESAVASARAQSKHYAVTECAPGQSPFNSAADDMDQIAAAGVPAGFTNLDDVMMLYNQNGEKTQFSSAKLPDPDLTGFMGATDERLARGFSSSLSRFTRKVAASWAGGRLEDQQDDPIIDQYRGGFVSSWQKVHGWFVEGCWLVGLVEMPGYNESTRCYWEESRAEFFGKVHINPVDTQKARQLGYMNRTDTPQQACEEDGKDLRENLRQWAEAMQLCREMEEAHDLDEGSLDFLLEGKALTTGAGDEVASDAPVTDAGPATAPPTNGRGVSMNRLRRIGVM